MFYGVSKSSRRRCYVGQPLRNAGSSAVLMNNAKRCSAKMVNAFFYELIIDPSHFNCHILQIVDRAILNHQPPLNRAQLVKIQQLDSIKFG